MEPIVEKLENLVEQISTYVSESSEEKLSRKWSPNRWSKKELLGHLIDSGMYNLQRFTEIQFEEKPYRLKDYKQDELVIANRYQEAETTTLLPLLITLNKRIIALLKLQTKETLTYEIITPNNERFHLNYLIEDYVTHFEHHLLQIIHDQPKKSKQPKKTSNEQSPICFITYALRFL